MRLFVVVFSAVVAMSGAVLAASPQAAGCGDADAVSCAGPTAQKCVRSGGRLRLTHSDPVHRSKSFDCDMPGQHRPVAPPKPVVAPYPAKPGSAAVIVRSAVMPAPVVHKGQ